jgi:1-aminocyclopropane-1-carboxylate deaminase/D-cysteine desulfhydrase-like pyridoxal-dependent ACC family enzyme
MSVVSLMKLISRIPRDSLANIEAPLEKLVNFSKKLKGLRKSTKRDAPPGLTFGGNKARPPEFEIGEALFRGAEAVVADVATQSNFYRQVAAACKVRLERVLVLRRSLLVEGNFFMDHLLGAEIYLASIKDIEDLVVEVDADVEELQRQGDQPYILKGVEECNPLRTLAFPEIAGRLHGQLEATELKAHFMFTSTTGPAQFDS